MHTVVGMVVVIVCVLGGFMVEGGHVLVLWQWPEFVIIGGCAIGSVVVSAPPIILKQLIGEIKHSFTNGKETPKQCLERLATVYRVLRVAQYDGATGLERHVERPKDSEIFKADPDFLKDHHLLEFFCDTMKIISLGSVPPHQVSELTDLSIKSHEEEMHKPISVIQQTGDALPGLGIVAAVLGIVITMGAMSEPPEVIGHKVASALVGTLLGVLLCYGFVGPLAARLNFLHSETHEGLKSLQACMVAFANGAPPQACVEFGRRALPSHLRPGFDELEKHCRAVTKNAPKPGAEAAAS
jgi:chemotaxis protein MotA